MGPERPASPMEARAVVDRLRPVLVAVRDPVERAMYVQRVARHLGVGEEAVLERVRALSPGRGPRPAVRQGEAPVTAEDVLLAILLRYPHLRLQFRSYPESLFSGAVNREVFRRWLHNEDFSQTRKSTRLGTGPGADCARCATLDTEAAGCRREGP